ncbi:MAG: N-formylglutamate deformylase [Pseudomonadota bacterium]
MSAPPPVEVERGDGPLVLGIPHAGTWLPDDVAARLADRGRALADTDWHVDTLYGWLPIESDERARFDPEAQAWVPRATTVRAAFHRYVVDANRDPSGASLYPGQNTTGLVPLTDFDGQPIWDVLPEAAEVEARRAAFHAPYHAALEAEMARVRAAHGVAVLFDCHSIRSVVPYLFEGRLPDLNIGTDGGRTCDPRIEAAVVEECRAAEGYTSVLNGRFRGGWTTRHYGRPAEGWHAVQMELAQATYLAEEAPPWTYDPVQAGSIIPHLRRILAALEALAPVLAAETKGTP